MSTRNRISTPVSWLMGLLTIAVFLACYTASHAGNDALFRNAVGGIAINLEGVLSRINTQQQEALRRRMQEALKWVPGDLNEPVELRKVSLRRLQEVLDNALRKNLGVLPDEVRYLGGLQRIKYVFAYPELNDIVLAGPAEGWTVDEGGDVVGVRTGRPVLYLDDLLVAFRSVDQAREVGISCSIDPTAEGRQRLESYLRNQKTFSRAVIAGIEKALGPQKITITGIPNNSHFAYAMVAADYRMKRIAMKLEASPVRGLPSFLDLTRSGRRNKNMMPRWWLACNYEPLARSEDGLAWEVRGPGVKAMTEEDFIAQDGTVHATGTKSPVAQKWAELMTANYEQLSENEPVFGQLRNIMDLCVVAAVIQKENLEGRAGCSLSLLTGTENSLMIDALNPPKIVATQCSFIKRGRNYVIAASGGVQIDSWQVANTSEKSDQIESIRAKAATTETTWWWN